MLKYRVFRVLSRIRMIIARPLALEPARSFITRIIKDVFSCRRNGRIRKLHASVSRISLFSLPRYLSLRETLSFVRSPGKIHICLLRDPRSLISCSCCIISSKTGYHRGKFIAGFFVALNDLLSRAQLFTNDNKITQLRQKIYTFPPQKLLIRK